MKTANCLYLNRQLELLTSAAMKTHGNEHNFKYLALSEVRLSILLQNWWGGKKLNFSTVQYKPQHIQQQQQKVTMHMADCTYNFSTCIIFFLKDSSSRFGTNMYIPFEIHRELYKFLNQNQLCCWHKR